MSIDAWLPVGYALPSGERTRLVRQEDAGWQIYEQAGGGSILVAVDDLWSRWRVDGFVEDGQSAVFAFGGKALHAVACDGQYELSLLERCRAPETKSEIISFVHALRSSRNVSPGIGLQGLGIDQDHVDLRRGRLGRQRVERGVALHGAIDRRHRREQRRRSLRCRESRRQQTRSCHTPE